MYIRSTIKGHYCRDYVILGQFDATCSRVRDYLSIYTCRLYFILFYCALFFSLSLAFCLPHFASDSCRVRTAVAHISPKSDVTRKRATSWDVLAVNSSRRVPWDRSHSNSREREFRNSLSSLPLSLTLHPRRDHERVHRHFSYTAAFVPVCGELPLVPLICCYHLLPRKLRVFSTRKQTG